MLITRPRLATIALTGAALSSLLPAQERFAEPVMIKAGDKVLGEGRMYPSPTMHDHDGDGLLDAFIGDLRGHITVALRKGDGTFRKEVKLKDAKKKIVDFGNW